MQLDNFFLQLKKTPLAPWANQFFTYLFDHLQGNHKKTLEGWKEIIESMPEVSLIKTDCQSGVVSAKSEEKLSEEVHSQIAEGFQSLNPWRKGPFNICGVYIDSEWRSDMKWDRLVDHIAPLKGKLVLDVGCGNGYHCFRALGEGADFALGIDHKITFFAQNQALLKYLHTDRTAVLPIGIDDMPEDCDVFDTVFSMGVLYHVHSPVDHLVKLKSLLKEGGEAVLETLVISGKAGEVLVPESRYACMPNVRNIPSCDTTIQWMRESGFQDVRLVDVTKTTTEEQHVNQWGVVQSLEHFLDKRDSNKTVEGYPAPLRGIFVAKK